MAFTQLWSVIDEETGTQHRDVRDVHREITEPAGGRRGQALGTASVAAAGEEAQRLEASSEDPQPNDDEADVGRVIERPHRVGEAVGDTADHEDRVDGDRERERHPYRADRAAQAVAGAQ